MSWIKGTASNYNDLSDKLVAAATGISLQSVDSIAAGGTGYSIGDILTLSGGTFSLAAQVEVLAVSSGVVTSVRLFNAGVYTVAPADPVATTGGAGDCTLNCTFAANGWTARINEVYDSPNKRVWLEGSGGGLTKSSWAGAPSTAQLRTTIISSFTAVLVTIQAILGTSSRVSHLDFSMVVLHP